MKALISTVAFMLTVNLFLPVIASTSKYGKVDAAHLTPPIVNNPAHIRNVVVCSAS